MLLGSISPAKKITTVVISVLSDTALRPQRAVTATVTIAAAARWTILVPISRVLTARSKWSSTYWAASALGSPFSAFALIFTRETEAIAVSVTAK